MKSKNDTIELVATLIAKLGKEQALQDMIIKIVPEVKAEDGCIEYAVHVDQDKPGVFVIYEIWASQAALDAHAVGPVLKQLHTRAEELLESPANLQMICRIA